MLNYSQFEGAISISKFIGFFAWSYLPFSVYLCIQYFILHKFHDIRTNLFILSFVTVMLPFIFYRRTLSVVPRPHLILSVQEWFQRFLFLFSEFIWLLIHLSSLLDNAVVTPIAIFIMGIIISRVMYIPVKQDYHFRKSRLQHIQECYPKTTLKLLGKILIVSLIFKVFVPNQFMKKITFGLLIGFCDFAMFEYILIMFSIIAGEKTSFKLTNDASRLVDGLNSNDIIFQYYASQDFVDIAKDPNPERREFLYKDRGVSFTKIVNSFIQSLDDFSKIESDSKASDVHLQNPGLIASIKSFYKEVFQNANIGKSKFKKFCEFPFLTLPKCYQRYRIIHNSVTMKKKGEYNAVRKTFIIMNEIEALTTFLFRATTEDKIGFIQVHAEKILSSLIKAYTSLNKNAHYTWVSPPFPSIANSIYKLQASSYNELVNYIFEITNWSLKELLLTETISFDYTLFSPEYLETIKNLKRIYSSIDD